MKVKLCRSINTCRDAGKVYAALELTENFHAIFDFKVSQSLIGWWRVNNRLKFNRICRWSTITKEVDLISSVVAGNLI